MSTKVAPESSAEDDKKTKKQSIRSPLKIYLDYKARLKLEEELRLLKREEEMKQDLERFLMELEERLNWVTYELKDRAYAHFLRLEKARKVVKAEEAKLHAEKLENMKETGLTFYRGDIAGYRKWQNSPSKHFDLKGHMGAVYGCKLSNCLEYVVSASADRTVRLWKLSGGKCIQTYFGHTKKITGCDMHPRFQIDSKLCMIVSCSGDKTLRLWSSYDERCLRVLRGHEEVVYKCSFSPDGRRVVSCSEDQTIRTWSVPEGYILYIFRGHNSPVTTVNFSPSGKYLVSASDYGERKIYLWDAAMPRLEQSLQFPHEIIWTPEGLVKRILMQKRDPGDAFWLTSDQAGRIDELMVQAWPGDGAPEEWFPSDDESDSERDSDDEEDEEEEEEKKEESIDANDTRDNFGVSVSAILYNGTTGKQTQANEYIPGADLVISLESIIVPISEAYVSVQQKKSQFDIFQDGSGTRLGRFHIEAPLPWQMDRAIIDPLGYKPPKRHAVPEGVREQANGEGFLYRETILYDDDGDALPPANSKVQVFWACPPPEMGPAQIVVNAKLRYETKWFQLTYSMTESVMRINKKKKGDAETALTDQRFQFDQEARHETFMSYIRDKNWKGVQCFLDQHHIDMFYASMKRLKKRRGVMRFLMKLFENTHSIVLATPFIYRPGQTRSTLLAEAMEIPPPEVLDEGLNADDEEDEEEEDGFTAQSPDDEDESGIDTVNQETADDLEKKTDRDSVRFPSAPSSSRSAGKKEEQEEEGDVGEEEDETDPLLSSKSQHALEHASGNVYHDGAGRDAPADTFSVTDVQVEVDWAARPPRNHEKVATENAPPPPPPPPPEVTSAPAVMEAPVVTPAQLEEWQTTNILKAFNTFETDGSGQIDFAQLRDIMEMLGFKLQRIEAERIIQDIAPAAGNTIDYTQFLEMVAPKVFEQHKNKKRKPEDLTRAELEDIKEAFEMFDADGSGDIDVTELQTAMEALGLKPKKKEVEALIAEIDTGGDGTIDFQEFLEMMAPRMGDKHNWFLGRKKTKPKHLPRVLFTEALSGPDVDKHVQQLAKKEAAVRVSLTKRGITSRGELNSFACHPDKVKMLEHTTDIPKKMAHYLRRKNGLVPLTDVEIVDNAVAASLQEALLDAISPDSYEPAAVHPLIKNGRYGPDIGEFSIPLPVNFPRSAGTAGPALQAQLNEYEKMRNRAKKLMMPTRPDPPKFKFNLGVSKFLENINGKEEKRLAKSLRKDASLFLLTEHVYLATRRGAQASLPGMQSHYPNVLYTAPAVVEKGCEYPEEGTGFFGKMFAAKKKAGMEIAAPVGRKKVVESAKPLEEAAAVPSAAAPADLPSAEHTRLAHGRKHHTHATDDDAVDPSAGVDQEAKPELENTMPKETVEETKETDIEIDTKHFFRERRGSFPLTPGLVPIHLNEDEGDVTQGDGPDPMKTGGMLRRFRINGVEFGHQGCVNDATFSPSELRIATAGGDKLIKLWDPRDGTFVRSLRAHEHEVTALCYTRDELYLVSAGADTVIMVWDLSVHSIIQQLRGHADVIYSLSISPDCSFVVSAGHDNVLKTWFLTPRIPDHIDTIKVLSKTDRTVLISWTAPTSFGEEISAYFIQYRTGTHGAWQPAVSISVPPIFRNKLISRLVPATRYQFQMRAENRMGKSDWGPPSKVIETEYGMPDPLERPRVADVTRTSMLLYWYTPNPHIFGSSPWKFLLERNGEGLDFDMFPALTVGFQECLAAGQKLMEKFKRCCESGKVSERMIEEPGISSGMDLKTETMELEVRRYDDENIKFMAYEVRDLDPGFMFRFRVTGINRTGTGPPSIASYSASTNPGEPRIPSPAFIAKKTLTTIKFQWDIPDDCGSAIIGYRIYIKHHRKYYDLPRGQTKYKIFNLRPGRSYFLKVLAKNGVGWSEYSEYNSIEDSRAAVQAPDKPDNPFPIAGTYNTITLKLRLPFCNGSEITSISCQRRIIEAFSRGEWTTSDAINLPGDVDVLEAIEAEEEEKEKTPEEIQKAIDDYNPFLSRRDPNYTPPKGLVLWSEADDDIDDKPGAPEVFEKPKNGLISFTMKNLEADTLYEFRVACKNDDGLSEYSIPSLRAKTRRDTAPGSSRPPTLLEIKPNFASLVVDVPPQGGAAIECFHIDIRDVALDTFVTRQFKFVDGNPQFRISGLKPGSTVQFRSRAENKIGQGPSTTWTGEMMLPLEDVVNTVGMPAVSKRSSRGSGDFTVKMPPQGMNI